MSAGGLAAWRGGVPGFVKIRNDIIRGRIGNYTEVLGIVNYRFHGLDSGVNRMRGVDTVKHVALMGGNCNYVGEAKLTRDWFETG